jgi:hypothetical protein
MCIVVAGFVVTFTRLNVFMLAPAVPVLFPRVGDPCSVMDAPLLILFGSIYFIYLLWILCFQRMGSHFTRN